jgi:hypothetical protein
MDGVNVPVVAKRISMPEPNKDRDPTVEQWRWLRRKLPVVAWSMLLGAIAGMVAVPWVWGSRGGSLEGGLGLVFGAVVGLVAGVLLQIPVLLAVWAWHFLRGNTGKSRQRRRYWQSAPDEED